MSKIPHYNQQAVPEQCKPEVECIYVFTKTWKMAIYIGKYYCHVNDNTS